MMGRSRGVLAALACGAALLVGCAADKPKPTALDAVTPQIAGKEVWRARLDAVQFPLGVTVRNGQFFVAGSDGTVLALDAASGREAWRANVGAKLSAGVGSDGRHAAVVTRDNELVVVDQGTVGWRKPLGSRVVTPPFVAGGRVFVMGVDRVVHAFDLQDGAKLWSATRPGEALTLAQPGLLMAYQDTLVAGIGAVMVGIDPTKGSIRWELPLTSPRGTNEVERLNDLLGPPVRVGDVVCARAFQTAVGCADLSRRSVRWSRNAGGVTAVGGDAEFVFGADGSDRISAWRATNGDLAWTNERLLYRSLSAPQAVGNAVIFGDLEGQVHFLSRAEGKLVLRLPTDGSPVVAQPALSGNTVLVVTRNGGLFAFRPE